MTSGLEVCVVDPAGVAAAISGGADRLELCAGLEIGGVTPTLGFVRWAQQQGLPVYVLIRSRGGNFVYSPAEIEIMRRDIVSFQTLGVGGFVLGALTLEGHLDTPALEILVEACGEGELTLHRAFDHSSDQNLALEQAIELGFHRVLTSGGSATAHEGLAKLSELRSRAKTRIRIVPGGGIDPTNLARILGTLGATDIHASCKTPKNGHSGSAVSLGAMGSGGESATNPAMVRALSDIIVRHNG